MATIYSGLRKEWSQFLPLNTWTRGQLSSYQISCPLLNVLLKVTSTMPSSSFPPVDPRVRKIVTDFMAGFPAEITSAAHVDQAKCPTPGLKIHKVIYGFNPGVTGMIFSLVRLYLCSPYL